MRKGVCLEGSDKRKHRLSDEVGPGLRKGKERVVGPIMTDGNP